MTVAPRVVPQTRFVLPPGHDATVPPERRGLDRDQVRLLVARPGQLAHQRFRDLPAALSPGDLVVINTSATLPAALRVGRQGRTDELLHVSTALDDGSWVVELRRSDNQGPADDVELGELINLAGGPALKIIASYPAEGVRQSRLWRAAPRRRVSMVEHLLEHGQPIRYGYVEGRWPLSDLQNVYADQPGSAEMPSAGRPFTTHLITRLAMRGIRVAPLVLHTGVSSPEKHEPPSPERFEVPAATAALVNQTRAEGGRVIAVGTTVVRALETVAGRDGVVAPGGGWTDLVLGPGRPAFAVTGLITGLHEPEASHLLLLEAVAGPRLVADAYAAAIDRGYLWHEFGDSMLFLP
jgi:S-adenosylmethionine:tRNA ribosyltransferase-isomerase